MTYPNRYPSGQRLAILSLLAIWSVGQADASELLRIVDPVVVVHCAMTVGGSFEARTTALSGALSRDSHAAELEGQLTLDLATLDTGISMRNEHMREKYLEVNRGEKFATAQLSRIKLALADDGSLPAEMSFVADLTVHGETRRINGTVKTNNDASDLAVTASFVVNITDYGIAKPRHMGVGIKDEIKIDVKFKLASTATNDGSGS